MGRPKGLLNQKRARRLREMMRDTKSAPIGGMTQARARSRIIGTASPQAANIVLAYHDKNARLRSEVERLRRLLEAVKQADEMVCERMADLRCGECSGCERAREDGAG